MQKTALITGITGQDGAYLAQYLLDCGYKVYGTYRRLSTINLWRIKKLKLDINPNLILLEHDLLDLASCIRAIEISEPNEVYNLAAQSFVSVSFHAANPYRKYHWYRCRKHA